MDKTNNGSRIIFCFILVTSIATSRAIPIDYENDEVSGNLINLKDDGILPSKLITSDNDDYYRDYSDVNKRDPEMFEVGRKRNIISALRAKMRRSNPNEIEEKYKFSPFAAVDALGNLNGFFDSLASNIHTMESRNLLPNQMRLLGENDRKDLFNFVNSARVYQSPNHIRKLINYTPDTHRNSNFYDPVITRIGLGRK